MAEYARYYGGPPAADMPWPLFKALVARTARFEARSQLSQFDAVASAIGVSLSKESGAAKVARDMLFRSAYPVKDVEPVFYPNMFDVREREVPSA